VSAVVVDGAGEGRSTPLAPQTAPARPGAPPALTGGQLALGTVALSLATFMNVLDTSIANVSIPAIAGDFGVAPNQGTWVITSFAVANAISVPLTGWLTQRFGQVRLFTISIILFVLASLLCGLAPNLQMLIAFRVLQGAVAGPMIPLSQTLLLSSYPPAKAGMALAMWSMTTLVAPVAGPLVGGYISDNWTWPWIFYINIPVGVFAAWFTWRIYAKRESPTRKVRVDGVGLALLVLWVGSMQLVLDKGKELDWFSSKTIIALAVVAVVCFVFFLIWELTDDHPVVDLRLYAGRNFAIGGLALALAYGLFFGNVVLLPLWLQQYMGYTATQAGMVLAPVGVFAIILSPWVGRNLARYDARWLTTVAFVTFAIVMYMRSRFTVQTDLWTLMVPTLLQGVALAFFFVPLMSISLSGLPPERMPAASGLTNFTRITAGAFGTSISTTVWDNRAALHHAQLTDQINGYSFNAQSAIGALGAGGLSGDQPLGLIDRLINQQAYTLAADEIFLASAVIFVVLLGVIWLARPKKAAVKPGQPAAGMDAH
jgi:DHA2 family multidrug resistance protein